MYVNEKILSRVCRIHQIWGRVCESIQSPVIFPCSLFYVWMLSSYSPFLLDMVNQWYPLQCYVTSNIPRFHIYLCIPRHWVGHLLCSVYVSELPIYTSSVAILSYITGYGNHTSQGTSLIMLVESKETSKLFAPCRQLKGEEKVKQTHWLGSSTFRLTWFEGHIQLTWLLTMEGRTLESFQDWAQSSHGISPLQDCLM